MNDELLRLGRLVPADQELVCMEAGRTVADALKIMRDEDFDQLPVTANGKVAGFFSYRSLAQHLQFIRAQDDPTKCYVEDFLEDARFARASSDIGSILPDINSCGAVLVGDENQPLAIVTRSDLGVVLWKSSHVFILIEDVERTIRTLMTRAANGETELRDCIAKVVVQKNLRDLHANIRLADLTYSELLAVLTHPELFGRVFSRTFGRQRPLVNSMLQPVREVRNKAFHFRDEVTAEETRVLETARAWLLRRVVVSE